MLINLFELVAEIAKHVAAVVVAHYSLIFASSLSVAIFGAWFRRRARRKRLARNRCWPEASGAINKAFLGKATLVGLLQRDPILDIEDIFNDREVDALSDYAFDHASILDTHFIEVAKRHGIQRSLKAEKVRAHAAARAGKNAPQALVAHLEDLYSSPPRWRVTIITHSSITALRLLGAKPNVLSGNVVLCCAQRGSVLLHSRSNSSDTMKGRLHFFGGAYQHSARGVVDDERSVRRTAERELFEEARVNCVIPENALTVASIEDETGFVQVTYLGVDVPSSKLPLSGNSVSCHTNEGDMIEVPFEDLGEILCGPRCTPTAKAAILLWLALGAPTTGKRRFSTRMAQDIYKKFIQDAASGHPGSDANGQNISRLPDVAENEVLSVYEGDRSHHTDEPAFGRATPHTRRFDRT